MRRFRLIALAAILTALTSLLLIGTARATPASPLSRPPASRLFDQTVTVSTNGDAANNLQDKSPIELWEVLVALAIPMIVQVAKKDHWTDETTRLVGIVGAVVSTGVAMALKGDFTHVDDWITTLGVVIAGSQAAYQMVWKSSLLAGVSAKLGSVGGGPSEASQRAGYQGITATTPPPGP